jgi:hypothetical protein
MSSIDIKNFFLLFDDKYCILFLIISIVFHRLISKNLIYTMVNFFSSI